MPTDSKVAAWWPVIAAIIIVAFGCGIAIAGVAKATERAAEAMAKATQALDTLNTVNVRLERIQTVLERIERSTK